MKVAVVHSQPTGCVITVLGEPSAWTAGGATVQAVAGSLREHGHNVAVCDGDARLLASLQRFMPSTPAGLPGGMAFNLATGVQGEACRSHVPAMLEMSGVPYTGAAPLGLTIADDALIARALIVQAGIPAPRFRVMRWPGDDVRGLRYPLLVTPRYAAGHVPDRVAQTRPELGDATEQIVAFGGQEAFVEEMATGTRLSAALLGNDDEIELLALIARHGTGDTESTVVETDIGRVTMRSGALAVAAFRACHCRDHAVIDLCIDRSGNVLVVRVDPMPALDRDGAFVLAGVAAGYDPTALVSRILDVAHRRYFGVAAPRYEVPRRKHAQFTSRAAVLLPDRT